MQDWHWTLDLFAEQRQGEEVMIKIAYLVAPSK